MNTVEAYAEDIEKEGNKNIAETIRSSDREKLLDEGFMSALKQSNPELEPYLSALQQDLQAEEEQKPSRFDIEEHRNEDIQDIARIYADFLIEERNIRPVVIDSRTLFYQYDPEKKIWEEIDFEFIRKQANREIGKFYNPHFLRQFKQSFKDHYKYLEFEEMGLEEDEVLLKDGKILELDTMDTRPAKMEDRALNMVNAKYNPVAEPERVKEFIEKTLDEEGHVETVQEYLGYALKWPSDKFEKVLLILGYTDTGKSTLLKVIEQLFQGSNTTKVSFPQIGMDRAFHVEKLKDSVINFDMDMDDKEIPRKSRLKKVISNEEIHADPKGEKGYDFRPRTKFMIASNNSPDDSDATDAFYNRFLTVTATDRIDEEDKERNLVEKLTTEENLSWILNWALEGLERLEKQNQFSNQMSEYETKKAWDKFGTSTQKFINSQININSEDARNIPTTDVYKAYELWCEKKLVSAIPKNQFIAQAASHPDLRKKKVQTESQGRKSCFLNIEVEDYVV